MFKWLHKTEEPSGHFIPPSHVSELGVPSGGDDSIKWFRKAAEKGTAWGQLNLGLSFLRGDGIPQDFDKACHWFQKAAEQGDALSQYYLGGMHEKGLGVPVDPIEAFKWYTLAASHGIHEAEVACLQLRNTLTPEQIAQAQGHPRPVP